MLRYPAIFIPKARQCLRIAGLWAYMALCVVAIARAQELPRIVPCIPPERLPNSQTWGISQDAQHVMWLARNSGLAAYNGTTWDNYPLPNGQIVRAVATDSRGRIYVGGYAAFGYWARGAQGVFNYHPLSQDTALASIATEEIWNILPFHGGMLFQSFSNVYYYDNKRVKEILPPGNIMFIQSVGQDLLFPVIEKGIYRWHPDTGFVAVPGTSTLANKRVIGIVPLGEQWLVATEQDGIWQYADGQLRPWPNAIPTQNGRLQLNKMIRLRSGLLAVGTIQDGVYLLAPDGRQVYHIHQGNGLQNNTVLSLHEDIQGDLWVGLDRGTDLIVLSKPMLFYTSGKNSLGTVYAGAFHRGRLFIGTNQGLYSRPWGEQVPFELVPGSQGQVWSLDVHNGQLLCGHNNGTFVVDGLQPRWISNVTGGWQLLPIPNEDNRLIQCTYTGLVVLEQRDGQWEFSHKVAGFNAPIKQMAWDEAGKLWAVHPAKGLFRLALDATFHTVTEAKSIDEDEGVTNPYGLQLSVLDSILFLYTGTDILTRSRTSDTWTNVQQWRGIDLTQGDVLLAGAARDWFQATPQQLHYHTATADLWTFSLSLIADYPRVRHLSNGYYLFGINDGYALLPQRLHQAPQRRAAPVFISSVTAQDEHAQSAIFYAPPGMDSTAVPSLAAHQNNLTFHFAHPVYEQSPKFRYRLLGASAAWSEWSAAQQKEFTFLRPGRYMFELQSSAGRQTATFAFIIQPHWYQTLWAKLGYLMLGAGIGFLLYRLHLRRLRIQQRRMMVEKERELTQERIRARNEQLQADNLRKSQALANSTFNLIQKNNALFNIKEAIGKVRNDDTHKLSDYHYHTLNRVIDKHLSNNEEWVVFEENFTEVHDHFFKALKQEYPDLTPGDLKLAAYLRMNLSSKEIAPLLNISTRGVENKRYRLRTKLGLDAQANLVEFLMMK